VAMAATSEAMAFATASGLDLEPVLAAVNVSSGRNTATADKFPNQVVTGAYASGFANTLMAKDVRLYLEAVAQAGTPAAVGQVTGDLWRAFADAEPGVDFTRIFPYLNDI